jgi:hypothetical protein
MPKTGIVETIEEGPAGTDRVAWVTFSAGSSLKAGDCTDVQLRIHTSTYTNGFEATNDCSYRKNEWIANELVGLYELTDGLIWGIEPTAATSGAAAAP